MSASETTLAVKPKPIPSEYDAYATLPDYNAEGVIALLQAWSEDENIEEQQETLSYLQRVLNEDRHSDQKVFP